ncbi:MAG: DUF3574 domain-containing protein [Thermodesulfobacteriota bacterium]
MKRYLRLTLPAILLLVSGCAGQPQWTKYEVCFGLSSDAGQTRISDQDWERFRDEQIVTRFPDGFTLYSAQGYWQSGATIYAEPSMMLMVVSPDRESTVRKLDEIARSYKQQFHQESVLQIRSEVDADFNE